MDLYGIYVALPQGPVDSPGIADAPNALLDFLCQAESSFPCLS
jgi:hypothetical protein